MTLRIAALASGTGTNVANILQYIDKGRLDASVCLVASNKPCAPVVELARSRNIPTWAKDHKEAISRERFDNELGDSIEESGANIIVLAGYMRILSSEFINRFTCPIVNIHPAILPSFPGAHGGREAAEYGVRFTGCTVHFVNAIMDNGPVIIQAVIPLSPLEEESSFMPTVHKLEYIIYPQALQWIAEKRISIQGRRVMVSPSPLPQRHSVNLLDRPCLISPPLDSLNTDDCC